MVWTEQYQVSAYGKGGSGRADHVATMHRSSSRQSVSGVRAPHFSLPVSTVCHLVAKYDNQSLRDLGIVKIITTGLFVAFGVDRYVENNAFVSGRALTRTDLEGRSHFSLVWRSCRCSCGSVSPVSNVIEKSADGVTSRSRIQHSRA